MRIWKPVYILLEKWRFEFYCKWFGVSLYWLDTWNSATSVETGVSLAWKPVAFKEEAKSRYVHHRKYAMVTSKCP